MHVGVAALTILGSAVMSMALRHASSCLEARMTYGTARHLHLEARNPSGSGDGQKERSFFAKTGSRDPQTGKLLPKYPDLDFSQPVSSPAENAGGRATASPGRGSGVAKNPRKFPTPLGRNSRYADTAETRAMGQATLDSLRQANPSAQWPPTQNPLYIVPPITGSRLPTQAPSPPRSAAHNPSFVAPSPERLPNPSVAPTSSPHPQAFTSGPGRGRQPDYTGPLSPPTTVSYAEFREAVGLGPSSAGGGRGARYDQRRAFLGLGADPVGRSQTQTRTRTARGSRSSRTTRSQPPVSSPLPPPTLSPPLFAAESPVPMSPLDAPSPPLWSASTSRPDSPAQNPSFIAPSPVPQTQNSSSGAPSLAPPPAKRSRGRPPKYVAPLNPAVTTDYASFQQMMGLGPSSRGGRGSRYGQRSAALNLGSAPTGQNQVTASRGRAHSGRGGQSGSGSGSESQASTS